MDTESELSTALDPLRTMLASDGFGIVLRGTDPVAITIVATDDACGDCLVPESVMRPLIADMLAERGIEDEWTLSLPTAGGH